MNKGAKHKRNLETADEKLIQDFLKGKNKAFDKLVLKYQDVIFNLCYRMLGDYDEANDCAQETFIKVYKNLKKFEQKSAFSTWVYRIAVNTCKNVLSSSSYKRKMKMIQIDKPLNEKGKKLEISDRSFNPDKIFEKNEKQRKIQEAINKLPPKQKVLVILREIEGKPYEEISNITGMKLGTVKSKLSRARTNLRDKLKEVI